jgi:nicotinate-nucleotide pyrophosphorylase (carboxylating)
MELSGEEIDRFVRFALAEDVGSGDVTTNAVVPVEARCRARLLLEEPGVVCGLALVRAVFESLDAAVGFRSLLEDGAFAPDAPAVLAELEGPARAVLTGERTALNILGRLCGIATLTRNFVDAVGATGATILDTRKTTPGLRVLEKYAVRCGGGSNHRFGLDDGILVKDNHLLIAGGIAPAVAALRTRSSRLSIEVEADTLEQVREALAVGVERILLDNMTPLEITRAVELVGGRAQLEASGGISLATVRSFSEIGVDFISVGALTRGAHSLDVSLEVVQ